MTERVEERVCLECGGAGVIPTGECLTAMSGPTCSNPDCPPCQTPQTQSCPSCSISRSSLLSLVRELEEEGYRHAERHANPSFMSTDPGTARAYLDAAARVRKLIEANPFTCPDPFHDRKKESNDHRERDQDCPACRGTGFVDSGVPDLPIKPCPDCDGTGDKQ